jgi:hypothetical protein
VKLPQQQMTLGDFAFLFFHRGLNPSQPNLAPVGEFTARTPAQGVDAPALRAFQIYSVAEFPHLPGAIDDDLLDLSLYPMLLTA